MMSKVIMYTQKSKQFIALIVLVTLWTVIKYFIRGKIYEPFWYNLLSAFIAFDLFIENFFVVVVDFKITFPFMIRKERFLIANNSSRNVNIP